MRAGDHASQCDQYTSPVAVRRVVAEGVVEDFARFCFSHRVAVFVLPHGGLYDFAVAVTQLQQPGGTSVVDVHQQAGIGLVHLGHACAHLLQVL